jgi:hypothetical protein
MPKPKFSRPAVDFGSDPEGTMARTPDQTFQAFFDVFASGLPDATKITDLINLFCPNGENDAHGNPTIPNVGISHHGPDFKGVQDVTDLWQRFLGGSFHNFMVAPSNLILPGQHFNPISPPRLYSRPDYPTKAAPIPMIGIQCELSGDFFADWFQNPPHNSNPLSGIHPVPGHPVHVDVDACAVFAFDNTADSRITNLFVYLDRYKLLHTLQIGAGALLAGFSKALNARQEFFERPEKRQ